jgi:hypothetical protein
LFFPMKFRAPNNDVHSAEIIMARQRRVSSWVPAQTRIVLRGV